MKIIVIGAGAWGTALAIQAAARHEVLLWAREPAQVQAMRVTGENARYLPGIRLPSGLAVQPMPASPALLLAHADGADLVVLATPTIAAREVLSALNGCSAPVVWLCKGLEVAPLTGQGLLVHEIAAQVAPNLLGAVLSGPSFAQEVAAGLPAALVAASAHAQVRQVVVHAFHSPQLRVYANEDVVGVEVGGAVKNVLAIAAGFCDGMGFGLNARAALLTRGLAEAARLGVAIGAQAVTFMGLSGVGDLILTSTGDLSRNRRMGLLMAQGIGVDEALSSLGHVAEGISSVQAILNRAKACGVRMPVCHVVGALVRGEIDRDGATRYLMDREPGTE